MCWVSLTLWYLCWVVRLNRGTAKCSPGLVLALGRQCGQGCASRGLLKSQGYFPIGGQLSTIGEKRLEAVLGRAGDLLWAMCSEVRCSGSQYPSCWANCSGEELFLRVQITLSLPQPPEFAPFAQSYQPLQALDVLCSC